jgi:BASS family bile acid:Na+ symporter
VKTLIDFGVPAASFFLMLVVGLELTVEDFRRVARYPGLVAAATAGQIFLLPALASALIFALGLPEPAAAGLIIVVACPPAILSSVYVSLARGNTALAVTLNGVSDLLAPVTLPIAVGAGLALHLSERARVRPPLLLMMGQLVLLLLLPTALGMLLRDRFPEHASRLRPALRRGSLFIVVVIVAGIAWGQGSALKGGLVSSIGAAVLFVALAMSLGWVIGAGLRSMPADRIAISFVFASRSVAVAVVVAVTLLGRPDFLAFGTVFFLTHTALMLAVIGVSRQARLPYDSGR